MLDFSALDVAVGLFFLWFVLSLICSALNEIVASVLKWRSKTLGEGIENLLSGTDDRKDGADLAAEVYEHPLMQGLIKPGWGEQRRWPSYVPSRTFVAALLSLGGPEAGTKRTTASLKASIDAIPNEQLKKALTTLFQQAHGDVARFQASAEQWFDDSMERVSGWYRRKVQIALLVIGTVVVLVLNVDTVQVARHLWSDEAVRNAVVASANAEAADQRAQPDDIAEMAKTVNELEELAIPLGWSVADDATPETPNPQRLVWPWDDWEWFLAKLVGLILTVAALSLGAPFWFDLLSKVARLRATGVPPPTADSIRNDAAAADSA